MSDGMGKMFRILNLKSFMGLSKKGKLFLFLTATITILILIIFVKAGSGKQILTEDGGSQKINLNDKEKMNTYVLIVRGEKGGEKFKKEISVTLGKQKKESKTKDKKRLQHKKSKDEEFNENISEIVEQIENKDPSDDGKVILPRKLKDGTKLTWKEETNKNWFFAVLSIFLIIVFIKRQADAEAKRKQEIIRNSFIVSLPDFIGRLRLLMGGNCILDDAVNKILDSYKFSNDRTPFKDAMLNCRKAAKAGNLSIWIMLKRTAEFVNIMEFSLLVSTLMENRNVGTSINEKLAIQEKDVWEVRKNNAKMKIEKAGTRLSIPMGAMLLALIMVTAGPALLEV